MPGYAIPQTRKPPKLKKRQVQLVANGDLRLPVNQSCWPEQAKMEELLSHALAEQGYELIRTHPYRESERHGFIGSQKEGMAVFAGVDPHAPLIVAESVWQYSHHVLPGLISHRGPILTVRQLVRHLAGPGRHAQSQWLADQGRREIFDHLERGFHRRLLHRCIERLAENGPHQAQDAACDQVEERQGRDQGAKAWRMPWPTNCNARRRSWASSTRDAWACTTPSSPTSCSIRTGVYKERLSQSALYYETTQVSDDEAGGGSTVDAKTAE